MALHMEWQKTARRFGEAIIPLLLCCGILIWTLKLWKADLTIPFCYIGDGLSHQTWVKDIVDEGWHLHNHYLSFPGEMDSEDYPQTDNLSFRSEEHTSELQSLRHLVCRLLLEKKN